MSPLAPSLPPLRSLVHELSPLFNEKIEPWEKFLSGESSMLLRWLDVLWENVLGLGVVQKKKGDEI